MEAVQTFGRKVSFWRRGDKKNIHITLNHIGGVYVVFLEDIDGISDNGN
jgi:hypothetical protein